MHEQERSWLEAARRGDKQAFSHLVEAYQRPVYNLTFRMLGNAEEAEDAAQETFLRAYARLGQYDSAHKFSSWLFSIANHYCIDRLRRRRSVYVSIDDNPVLENLEEDDPQPEQSAVAEEQVVEIQALINQLEPDYRTPLILLYWEDQSYEEIATSMGLTVSAVKSRLFRARQKMADLMRMRKPATAPPGSGGPSRTIPPAQIQTYGVPFTHYALPAAAG
jgi:RNA polymerase sigma-70 factor (ECF subfamily)